jgi:hypothetical protein
MTFPLSSRSGRWPQQLALLLVFVLGAACGDDTAFVSRADIEVTPSELSFSQVILGGSAAQQVTVRSTGPATLVITDLRIEANTADLKGTFNFDSANPISLASGDELVLTVLYEPTQIIQASGDLVIGTNVRGREVIRVPLVTPPLAPVIVVSPSPIDFGSVPEGSSNTQRVTVTNRGTAPATITSIGLSGSNDYSSADLNGFTYPITLGVFMDEDPNNQPALTFDVVYRPPTPGVDEGILVVAYNALNGVNTQVELKGQVGATILTCAPDPVDFGPSPLATPTRKTVTCTNNGQTSLNLTLISLDPDESVNYALVNLPAALTAEPGSIALPPNSSFPFVVEYTPPTERTDLQRLVIDYTIGGSRERERLDVFGVGVDNRCPIAVARGYIRNDPNQRRGSQIDWATPTDILVLDGTGSQDPDGRIVEYEWSIIRAPQGTTTQLRPLDGFPDDTSRRQFFIPLQGRYEFLLRVWDDIGFQDCGDPAIVTVIALPDETIHIELTWHNPLDPDETDTQGSDVDLHFLKMPANWFSAFDCYYANKEPDWNPELPSLDIDDTDGAGPENIQMDNPVDCQWYAVGVHYFEKQFGTAYATVRIFIEAEQVAEFVNRPLQNTDDFWDVGRLHWPTGEFFAVDQIYPHFDSSTAIPPQLTPQMVESIANTGICN